MTHSLHIIRWIGSEKCKCTQCYISKIGSCITQKKFLNFLKFLTITESYG